MGSHRLRSKRKLHQNMLSRCSLMYTQYNFITYSYNISKCFELQFSWSEPCWSGRSGGARNCQGGETINRRARCKHCTKCFVTFVVERHCFCAQVIRCKILWRMYMPIIGNVKHGSSLTPNFFRSKVGLGHRFQYGDRRHQSLDITGSGLQVWWRTVSCHVGKIMGPSLNCLSMHGCRCDSLKVYLAVCWLSTRQSILEIQVMRYQWIFDWGDQKWGKIIMKLRSWISSLHRADYDTKRV